MQLVSVDHLHKCRIAEMLVFLFGPTGEFWNVRPLFLRNVLLLPSSAYMFYISSSVMLNVGSSSEILSTVYHTIRHQIQERQPFCQLYTLPHVNRSQRDSHLHSHSGEDLSHHGFWNTSFSLTMVLLLHMRPSLSFASILSVTYPEVRPNIHIYVFWRNLYKM
jgi:hypothetical protein